MSLGIDVGTSGLKAVIGAAYGEKSPARLARCASEISSDRLVERSLHEF